jgi:hypothetical protein
MEEGRCQQTMRDIFPKQFAGVGHSLSNLSGFNVRRKVEVNQQLKGIK